MTIIIIKLTDISLDRQASSASVLKLTDISPTSLSVKRNIRQLDYNYSLFVDL